MDPGDCPHAPVLLWRQCLRFDAIRRGLEVDDKDDKQLIVRLKEWVVSGMCERCQIVCHERKDGGVQGLAGDAVAAEAFEKARKAMTMEVS